MNLYFAPLEGITTYIYRETHNEMFGGADAYFAPFITPDNNQKIVLKSLKDILPENNKKVMPIPQALSNNGDAFIMFADILKSIGYNEININFGCPSGTVVKKGRGAGILKSPEIIDSLLSKACNCGFEISVKSRIGYMDTEDIKELLSVYNSYNLKELTIHPRTGKQGYTGEVDLNAFEYFYNNSKNPLCYNGDIETKEDLDRITSRFPNINSIMLGRGAIKNPGIFREIKEGKTTTTEELISFTKALGEKYTSLYQSDTNALYKLKEIWVYMIKNYPGYPKVAKAIKKSDKVQSLINALEILPDTSV